MFYDVRIEHIKDGVRILINKKVSSDLGKRPLMSIFGYTLIHEEWWPYQNEDPREYRYLQRYRCVDMGIIRFTL